MANYLTVDDLLLFLRARKSTNCHIAADWLEDNATSDVAARQVDRLEDYVLGLADSVEMRHVCIRVKGTGYITVRRAACLATVATRYARGKELGWAAIFRAADSHVRARAPSWAAHIVAAIRKGQGGPAPAEDEDGYLVEFLILKRVRVKSADDIQAEHDAARKLTPAQREAVHKVRILQGGKPLTDSFWSPDKAYWE